MSVEAPERIWAYKWGLQNANRAWVHIKPPVATAPDAVEYVRADKLEELAAKESGWEERFWKRDAQADRLMQERDKAEAALAERDKEIAEAATYAENLASALHSQHYAENTSWRPMSGDLTGLLTQIDNMTAGLARTQGGQR